ncbi:dynamin family protein [Puniceicoccaceae bacterium K14]|nr:dynamin family protein [Puniceicoccaceae bacterium K14]
MKTEIRTFCDDYAQQLAPFTSGLQDALKRLPPKQDDALLKRWRLRLQEVAHRAETLSGKIAQQQAFLLIFGPLKSGKSTLMNAISGAYVSEVSSLPAYPALVHVKHGQDRVFQATDYNGKKIEFANSNIMSEAIVKSHEELANKILEVERSGEVFDPQTHFPEAIRRLEVSTPADALKESGSVLVDTPGLYTRMRFGYDVMTRDFRDNASCAIFVVKSDNLFFEKVFEEFNELLGNFSRIFLVVNVDSSKKDLTPEGELVPSLESSNPKAVLDAFQSLAMSAPLREAYDSGNLNVYTIDLLKAAACELKKAHGSDNLAVPGDDDFQRFVGDLTDYLNSSDYLKEFMYDSVRVGENLQEEVAAVAGKEAPDRLKTEAKKWRTRLDEVTVKLNAIQRLQQIDWATAFNDIHEEKDRLLSSFSERNGEELSERLKAAVDGWLNTDDSLRSLRDDHLNKHVESETADDAQKILEHLKQRMESPNGGANFSNEEAIAFRDAGLKIEDIVPNLIGEIGNEEALTNPRIILNPEHMPIKRSFWDIILFRSKNSIQQKLFGPKGTEFVPVAKKQSYIGEKQREELRQRVGDFPKTDLPEIQSNFVSQLLETYVGKLSSALKEKCEALESETQQNKKTCEEELEANNKAFRTFQALSQTNGAFGLSIADLNGRYQIDIATDEEPTEKKSQNAMHTIDQPGGAPEASDENIATNA